MDKLYIAATQYTPEVIMEPRGHISFQGKSYPENTFEFYTPIMRWLESYFEDPNVKQLTVELEIIYFNSSSSKFFYDFFDVLDEKKSQISISVSWIYDEANESAYEAGIDFKDDFQQLDFNLVKKEPEVID